MKTVLGAKALILMHFLRFSMAVTNSCCQVCLFFSFFKLKNASEVPQPLASMFKSGKIH